MLSRQRRSDDLKKALGVAQHIVVPEAQDTVAMLGEPIVCVRRNVGCMLMTVDYVSSATTVGRMQISSERRSTDADKNPHTRTFSGGVDGCGRFRDGLCFRLITTVW